MQALRDNLAKYTKAFQQRPFAYLSTTGISFPYRPYLKIMTVLSLEKLLTRLETEIQRKAQ